jgi:4Fe-4S binding domain
VLGQISEWQMHRVRWVLAIAWLLLIGSLFYDPLSPWLTDPQNLSSPFKIKLTCIPFQNTCIPNQPYSLGAPIFWGMIVPSSVFILLVFGHETWRRICPLSFMSQIPRSLGWQRQKGKTDAKTGKTRFELVKIKKDSWIGQHYPSFQFAFLYVGLCSRLLFTNADRIALGIWLLATIAAAITVGYLYGGKAWCQYFCPMAPVQKIYAEPGGIFTSKAHMQESKITQSMCRTVDGDRQEQSACVACQSGCMDIDAERAYWDNITQPNQRFLYYGYCGLVVGFFCYHYLYAGNWSYFFSGIWARQSGQLSELLHPGFYIFKHFIAIPKLIAVPLSLAAFSGLGYGLGITVEQHWRNYAKRQKMVLPIETIRHWLFTFCTFFIFNFFFAFAGRSWINCLPIWGQCGYTLLLFALSVLWLYRTLRRSSRRYTREKFVSRFRKQLGKLSPHFKARQRALEKLAPKEVYKFAKTLPDYEPDQALQVYQVLMKEALEEADGSLSSQLLLMQLKLYQKSLAVVMTTQVEVLDRPESILEEDERKNYAKRRMVKPPPPPKPEVSAHPPETVLTTKFRIQKI